MCNTSRYPMLRLTSRWTFKAPLFRRRCGVRCSGSNRVKRQAMQRWPMPSASQRLLAPSPPPALLILWPYWCPAIVLSEVMGACQAIDGGLSENNSCSITNRIRKPRQVSTWMLTQASEHSALQTELLTGKDIADQHLDLVQPWLTGIARCGVVSVLGTYYGVGVGHRVVHAVHRPYAHAFWI